MTVQLRPHHLLCLLTYVGKGYTPDFVVNYDLIAKRLSSGEEIEVIDGPDDVCQPLLCEKEPHCWRESVRRRDAQAALDVGKLLGMEIGAGTRIGLDAALLLRMRTAYAQGVTQEACRGCEWSDLCHKTAIEGYRGVRIMADQQHCC